MRSGYQVEQVFVRPKGGGMELSFVLVAPSGALKHDKLKLQETDARAAVRRAASHLASRGDVAGVEGVRLRVERKGKLTDDATLKRLFVEAFQ